MIPAHRALPFVILLALPWTFFVPTLLARESQAVVGNTSAAPVTRLPLLSRTALDAYLQKHADRGSPLDLLPPLARQRFLDSLVFGQNGIGGFDTQELATELTPAEIIRVLSLFGLEAYAENIESRHPDGVLQWKRNGLATPGPMESGFDVLHQLMYTKSADQAVLLPHFETLSGSVLRNPDAMRRLDQRELIYLLRSVMLVAPETADPVSSQRLGIVVAAMERRGIA